MCYDSRYGDLVTAWRQGLDPGKRTPTNIYSDGYILRLHIYIYIYIHVYAYIYIYIYIYICILRLVQKIEIKILTPSKQSYQSLDPGKRAPTKYIIVYYVRLQYITLYYIILYYIMVYYITAYYII